MDLSGNLKNKNLIAISGKKQSGKNTIAKIINQLTNNKYEEKCFADKLKDIVCLLIGCTREQLEGREFKEKELGEEWKVWESHGFNFENKIEYKIFISQEEALKEFPRNIPRSYILTPRELLQLLGTDCGRQIIHPNIWVNSLMVDYKPHIENHPNLIMSNGKPLIEGNQYGMGKAVYPNWLITDVRFPNELQAIKEREGITIRVNRPCEECGVLEGHKMIPHKNKLSEHPSETALDNSEFDYVIKNSGTIEELIEQVKEVLIKESIL